MKYLRDRPYLLSRIAAVFVATFGGLLALTSALVYFLGLKFAGPIYAAIYQTGAPRFGIAFCVGLFLLLFGLVGRAVFHLAQAPSARHTDV